MVETSWIVVSAGDGVEAPPTSVEGWSGFGVRRQAWGRLLQGAVGEEQAARRSATHDRGMSGSVEKAVLYSACKVRSLTFGSMLCISPDC